MTGANRVCKAIVTAGSRVNRKASPEVGSSKGSRAAANKESPAAIGRRRVSRSGRTVGAGAGAMLGHERPFAGDPGTRDASAGANRDPNACSSSQAVPAAAPQTDRSALNNRRHDANRDAMIAAPREVRAGSPMDISHEANVRVPGHP